MSSHRRNPPVNRFNSLFLMLGTIYLLTPLVYSLLTIRVRLVKESFFVISVFLFILIFSFSKIPLLKQKIHIPLMGIILYTFIAALMSSSQPVASRGCLHWIAAWALVILLIQILSDIPILKRFLDLLLMMSGIVMLIGVLEGLGFNPLKYRETFSPGASTLTNTNFAGAFLVAIGPYIFIPMFLKKYSKKRKIFHLVLTLLWVTHLFFSKARAAWLAEGAAILLFVFIATRGSAPKNVFEFTRVKKIFGIFFIFVIILFIFKPENVLGVFFKFKNFLELTEGSTLYQRISIYKSAGHMISIKPYTGWGPRAFPQIYPLFKLPSLWKLNTGLFAEKTHNQFLSYWVELGLAGLGLFLWIVFSALFTNAKKYLLSPRTKTAGWLYLASFISILSLGFNALGSTPLQIFPTRLIFCFSIALPFCRLERRRIHSSINFSIPSVAGAVFLPFVFLWACFPFAADIYGYHAGKNRRRQSVKRTLQELKQARELNPYKIKFYLTGDEILSKNRPGEERVKLFQSAIHYFPTYPPHYLNFGNIYFNTGKKEDITKAIKLYKRSIRANPFYPSPYIMLGTAYRFQGKLKKARLAAYLGNYFQPQSAIGTFDMGAIYFDLKRMKAAERIFKSAILLDESLDKPYQYIAQIKHLDGEFSEALKWYRKTLEHNPHNGFARNQVNRIEAAFPELKGRE